MVNRPAGGPRSVKHPREPFDWYCENATPVDQLMEAIDFGDDLILDPTCGRANILDVARRRGHRTVGIDLHDRRDVISERLTSERHSFARGDFLRLTRPPATRGRALSILNNPPYSYVDGIAERVIRKALDLPVRLAAFVVPIAFLCSDERWAFFQREIKPWTIAILSERPSMPPGSTLTRLTKFKGGMGDYIWIVYRPPHRWETRTIWLRPTSIPDPAMNERGA
jgi:hypothetical protein